MRVISGEIRVDPNHQKEGTATIHLNDDVSVQGQAALVNPVQESGARRFRTPPAFHVAATSFAVGKTVATLSVTSRLVGTDTLELKWDSDRPPEYDSRFHVISFLVIELAENKGPTI